MKKVSIIVPVYNVEDYLEKCLNSLVSQTLEDIEIIVVNDGTKDNSQKIIDKFVKKYPKKVFSYAKENGGLSSARNYGIKKAKGEYIGFVDSDDYVEYNMFELMYNKAKETSSDVVCCQVAYRYNKKVEKRYFNSEETFGKSVKENPQILLACKSYAWNKIYKRELWKDFEFPKQYFEDSAVIYNVLYNAKKIECVNYPLYNYIKERDNQITTSMKKEVIYDIFKSCDGILEFYKDKDIDADVINYLCMNHLIIRFGYILKDRKKMLAYNYYNDMIDYLNKNIKSWRKNKYLKLNKTNKKHRAKSVLLKYPWLTRIIVLLSLYRVKGVIGRIKRLVKKVYNKFFGQSKEKRSLYVRKNGYQVLEEISKIMNDNDILCFADFGTLLGLIRDQKIMDHDLDMDLGIVGNDNTIHNINYVLEKNNFKLWREYIGFGKLIERSYHYKKIKIDFNFYYDDAKNSKTYLFFRDPQKTYKNNERNIVEMKYSKIKGFKQIKIKDFMINVPKDSEKLLEEKYGKNWRVPDKGWIYWKSPAATILDETGYYIVYKHVREEF